MFRQNTTLKLWLQSNSSINHYETSNLTNPFEFTWEGFIGDGKPMTLVKSLGNLVNFQFHGYTFISPYMEILKYNTVEYITQESNVVQCQDINYGIFVAIAFAVGVIMKSDNIVARTLKIFSKVLKSEIDQSVYVELDTINTTL